MVKEPEVNLNILSLYFTVLLLPFCAAISGMLLWITWASRKESWGQVFGQSSHVCLPSLSLFFIFFPPSFPTLLSTPNPTSHPLVSLRSSPPLPFVPSRMRFVRRDQNDSPQEGGCSHHWPRHSQGFWVSINGSVSTQGNRTDSFL